MFGLGCHRAAEEICLRLDLVNARITALSFKKHIFQGLVARFLLGTAQSHFKRRLLSQEQSSGVSVENVKLSRISGSFPQSQ